MNKIRTWFNKAKKEVENQLTIQPLTPEGRKMVGHDVTVAMEMMSTNQRDLNSGLTGQTTTGGSEPGVIQTSRLIMLREHLQANSSQEEEVSVDQQQHYCPEHLRTTKTTTVSAPLPLCSSLLQVEQVTGNETSAGLPVQPLLKTIHDRSLPSSPHPGGRTRLPYSLPCSPLLVGRHQRSSPSCPSPPLGRLWVEAALQRSKSRLSVVLLPPSPASQVRQDEGGDRWEETGGEEEEEEKEEEGKEEKKKGEEENKEKERTEEEKEENEEKKEEKKKEEEDEVLCLDSEVWRYCLMTPCICFRCPSAPPYEAQHFSPGHIQRHLFSSEDQTLSEGLTQRTDVQRPLLGQSPRLYPSLSLWRPSGDAQNESNRKQKEEVNSFDPNATQFCFHGNTKDHLQRLCEVISGELQTVCSADMSFILPKVFDSTTCSKTTARPAESCSFCSDKLSIQILRHVCRKCEQVFCGPCLSRFVSSDS